MRSELEKLEVSLSKETVKSSEMRVPSQKSHHHSIPVMDVVDRLRLNLFKVERLQSKLSLALGEVSQILVKK